MSRSHHNTHSQQQNHHTHHPNSWFMSQNLVNNLFCSPGNNVSANCNNTFLNGSNINNHLTNLLSTQHHFLPPNQLTTQTHPHSSQSPLAGNGSLSNHYHGSHQHFPSQPYSSMFPATNSHSNSSNIGSNGRLIVGQNNHHYQNSSNHSRSIHSNRISRLNMKYQPGYGSNGQVLSLPGSNLFNKSMPDFTDKSISHLNHSKDSKSPNGIFNQIPKQNAWCTLEADNSATKQSLMEHNQTNKFYQKHQSVKGMENIKLDNEGVPSNYNPMPGAMPKQLTPSFLATESLGQSQFASDTCDTSNNSSEYFMQQCIASELDNRGQKVAVKFTLSQSSTNIDDEELIYPESDTVDRETPNSEVNEKESKKPDTDSCARNPDNCDLNTAKVETDSNSECEGTAKRKQRMKFCNQIGDCQEPTTQFPGPGNRNSVQNSSCPNMDFFNNEKNFLWQSHNQMFANHPQSALINQYSGHGGHYTSNGLLASVNPQNMSNYLAAPTQNQSNFPINCSPLSNPNNNILAAAYMASSIGGHHPVTGMSNVSPKCNIYRQDNSFSSTYHDVSSSKLWQYYITNRQTEAMYVRKVQLRNALHMVMSYVFENAGLFIVGSSMNGFGNDNSDMDLCLTITSKELHQKKEAFVVLNQLVEPLRKCSFIKNLQLIRATVPILKFRDTLAGVDCDLNINNVVGIYNTHLLAMYNRVDWRLRPLGMYLKHWAQKVDLHDASRGRLSTYTLILMLIQYLQAGCKPAVLPCLQAGFPKQFSYDRQVKEVDMRLELPWDELRSTNTSKLSDLLMGFFEYYVEKFDFARMAVSIRTGKPIPIEMAIKQLPPHEQLHNVKSFKLYIEEPFSLTNVARSLFDGLVFSRIKRCFRHSLQVMRLKQSLKMMFVLPTSNGGTCTSSTEPSEPCRSLSNQSETTSNSNQDDNSKALPLSDSNDNSEKSDISCIITHKSDDRVDNFDLEDEEVLCNFESN